MTCLYSFLTITFVSFISFLAQSQELRPGVLRVKLNENYVHNVQRQTLADGQFGISTIDDISAALQVKGVRRLFRESGKFEKAHRHFGLHLWYEISFDHRTSVNTAIKAYQGVAAFEIVEPLRDYHAIEPVDFRLTTPSINALTDPTNDPLFPQQWHYQNTGQSGGTPGADISLPQAWALQTGNLDVVVAVIDGGIDVNHPDLTASMWTNTGEIASNGIDDDNNGYVDDIYGYGFGDNTGTIYPHYHGTHVAGTIAAVTNNSVGVSGIAGGSGSGNGVRLMSCAGFGQFGTGGFEDAMVYAADNGAIISQNSWGGGSSAIEDAIDYFIARAGYDNSDENFDDNIQVGPMAGGIVIFAAGNSNTDNTSIGYPASYPPVMAVASTTHTDEKSYFSNYGSWVDIAAPGSDVYSTYPTAMGSYAYLSGTSMACPHVSGVASLIISEFTAIGLQPIQVWDRLQFAADEIDALNPGYEGRLGSGRVNAFQALQVEDEVPPSAIADLGVTAAKLNSIVLQWTAPGASGSEGAASYYDIRYSTSPITAANFDDATQVPNSPRPQLSGTPESFEIGDLLHSTTYYFALKARDFFGNTSDISNAVSVSTLPPPVIGVAPPAIEEDLFTGGSVVSYLTVTNTGASDLFIDLSSESLTGFPETATSRNSLPATRSVKGLETLRIASAKKYENISTFRQGLAGSKKIITTKDEGLSAAGRLFALNHSTGLIEELDPETGDLLNEITAPESFSGGPDGLAFDGTYLYYFNGFGTNTIHRIDASTGELQGSLSLGSVSVDGLAHSGEFVYALDYSGKIYEINFDEGEVLRTITPSVAVGGGISYGGKRGTLFVSNFSTGIYEIDVESGAVINSIPVPGTIYGVGYSDGLNLLFVANVTTGNADALDPETGAVLFSLPGVLSAAMASDEAGNQWLIPSEDIAIVSPGTSEQVPVTLNAEALIGGTYYGQVNVASNDPVTPLVEIPVTLNVTGAPNVNLSLTEIQFPDTYTGQQSVIELVMKNTGTDVLNVTAVGIAEPAFTEDGDAVTLNVGEASTINITFAPGVTGDFHGSLLIESNDPDESSVAIPLSGLAVTPPAIEVDPTELAVALFTGESVTETLTVSNTGGSDLIWNVSFTSSGPESTLNTNVQYFQYSNATEDGLNNSQHAVSSRIESEAFPLAAGDFTSKAASPVPLTSLAVDPTTGYLYGQADGGLAFYSYDPQLDTWTTLASCPLSSGNNGGATYLDGKIYTIYTSNASVMGIYTIATNSWLTIENGLFDGTGNIASDGENIYVVAGYVLKKYNPATSAWTTLANPPFSFQRWGGFSYNDGIIYGHQGDGYTGFAKYDIATNTWTSLPNLPGGAVLGSAIDPTANKYFAYGSYGGNNWYAYDIAASTWSLSTIPLFSINDGGLAFIGKSGVSGIYFLQGQSGTGLGRFETAPSFSWVKVDPFTGEHGAGEDQQIAVTFDATGLFGGVYSGVIEFHSNDPDNEVLEVPVTLTVTGAPDIETAHSNIAFENVFVGFPRDSVVVITNSGTDVLTISAIDSDNPLFTVVDFSVTEVDPQESISIAVRFSPDAASSYDGTLTITSDDPDEPVLEVALSGVGVSPPIMVVTPDMLSADLLTGQSTTRVVTVENNGESTLSWNLAVALTSPATLAATYFQPKADGLKPEVTSVSANSPQTSFDTELHGGPYLLAPGDFTSMASSPVPLTAISSDPATGFIYGQANGGYAFYGYNPATNLWTSLTACPIYSGNNGGATHLNGKIYTVYTENSSTLGVYTISSNSWTTVANGLGSGTGQITTDGTYLYLAVGSVFKRYDPSSNVWTTLSAPPIYFEAWGGLSHINGIIYGHQGNSGTGFAKYNITANSWVSLPDVPGGAVLGSAIDPVGNKYYTYGSYTGTNFYAFDLAANTWSVASIPLFSVNDGGLASVRISGYSGIYFVSGESGTGFGKFETLPFESWLHPSPLSGEIEPGQSSSITVTLSADYLPGGLYEGTLVISGNDPANGSVDVPVTLSVTSAPQIETDAELDFGIAYVNFPKDSSISILNSGTATLVISSITSSSPNFLIDFTATELAPGQSIDINVSFLSDVARDFLGSLAIHSNDPDEPVVNIAVSASAIVPPLTVSPTLIELNLPQFSNGSAPLVITNSGTGTLNWSLETSGDGYSSLEEAKQRLIDSYANITALIPAKYDFTEGETGALINDGGSDMYDGGNIFTTDVNPSTWIPYTNGSILPHSSFGLSGQYFTLKRPGLFVLAADVDISSFVIDGNLGADGGGSADGTVITAVSHGIIYKGFVKRVYNAGDPSVNHLIITADNGLVNHIFTTDTNSDYHRVENLTGINRIYHLLFAASGGGYVTNESMQSIMEMFLSIINGSPSWLSFSTSSGIISSGQSETIDVIAETDGLVQGTYTAQIHVNDGLSGISPFSSTVVLNVSGVPDIDVVSTMSFEKTFVGGAGEALLWVKNVGSESLDISGISTNSSVFSVISGAMTINPGDSASIVVTFTPLHSGTSTSMLTISSNDPNESQISVHLSGLSSVPATAVIDPDSVVVRLYKGESRIVNLEVKNTGDEEMYWTFSGIPIWAYADISADTLLANEESIVKLIIDGANLVSSTDFNLFVHHNNPFQPVAVFPVTVTVVENGSPYASISIPDQVVEMNSEGVVLNLVTYFSDPDLDALKYSVELDINITDAVISGSVLTMHPVSEGVTEVLVRAEDPVGNFAEEIFSVSVIEGRPENQSPFVLTQIEDQELELGFRTLEINLAEHFSDPENDALTFGYSGAPELLEISLVGSVLTINPLQPGDATVTITAEDENAGAEMSFLVTVYNITSVENGGTKNGLSIHPNPFAENAVIEYHVNGSAHVQLILFDVTGREKRVLVDEFQMAGKKAYHLNADLLPSGLYICKFSMDGRNAGSRKVIHR